jgi:NlpC/P60 family protein/putative peptidoglycan binding protein
MRRPGAGHRSLAAGWLAFIVLIMVMSGCGGETEGAATPTGSGVASPTPTRSETLSPTNSGSDDGSGLLQPTTAIVAAHGCAILTPGMTGVKVKMVQRRLGFPADKWETVDDATIAAVRSFQQQHVGLIADGVVGPDTWKAMGFREDFCFDRYQATPALPATATAQERREQMIAFANGFLGEEYVWGGAGPRGYGVDCSGLVLQALYSAGLDPQPITVDKHVSPDYRTSRELYGHPRLAHLPRSDVSRGDLVFWRSNETGLVNHVAIYLGDGKVLEAVQPQARIGELGNRSTQTMMPEVVRPFGA